MKRIEFTLSVAALVGAVAFAGSTAQADGYGQAGCGLGSLAVKKNNWLQIFAATLNGFSGNQTFGISSGTSNCDGSQPSKSSAKAFIETNRVALSKEIAQGGGESVASLSTLAGCSNASAVGGSLQKSFDKIFTASTLTDAQIGDNVMSALNSDTSLQCSVFN